MRIKSFESSREEKKEEEWYQADRPTSVEALVATYSEQEVLILLTKRSCIERKDLFESQTIREFALTRHSGFAFVGLGSPALIFYIPIRIR